MVGKKVGLPLPSAGKLTFLGTGSCFFLQLLMAPIRNNGIVVWFITYNTYLFTEHATLCMCPFKTFIKKLKSYSHLKKTNINVNILKEVGGKKKSIHLKSPKLRFNKSEPPFLIKIHFRNSTKTKC